MKDWLAGALLALGVYILSGANADHLYRIPLGTFVIMSAVVYVIERARIGGKK
jgi:hypothetical protein